MITVRTTKIDWDTDGDKEVFDDLPQRVIFSADDEESVIDELSNIYGWCIHELDYEIWE